MKILLEKMAPSCEETLRNGFRRCLSRQDIIKERKFETNESNTNGVINEVLLKVLKEKRFGNQVRAKKRARLNVQPGKSIGDEDEEDDTESEDDDLLNFLQEQSEEDDPADENDDQVEEAVEDALPFEEDENGRWIIAKFIIKRTYKYYVSKVIEDNGSNHLEVASLRKVKRKPASFRFPDQKDENCISLDQVVKDLSIPKKENGYFSFDPEELKSVKLN